MGESLSRLGETVRFLSDGETGERGNYVMHLGGRLAENPGVSSRAVVSRLAGVETEMLRLTPRRGHVLKFELGELGYCRDWAASLPIFEELRASSGRSDLRYMMGVAPPWSIALPFFGLPFGAFRAVEPLARALHAEIAEAAKLGGDALVVQIDAAIEQILVARFHGLSQRVGRRLARRFARRIASLVDGLSASVPVGVHLCLGNPGNQRVITPPSAAPVVSFANALAEVWSDVVGPTRPLDYVHLPFVDTADPRFYEPLHDLRLHEGTRLIAGLVYEDGNEANRERLDLATAALGFAPDVACACGMGRRTADVARQLLDEMRALAATNAVRGLSRLGERPKTPDVPGS